MGIAFQEAHIHFSERHKELFGTLPGLAGIRSNKSVLQQQVIVHHAHQLLAEGFRRVGSMVRYRFRHSGLPHIAVHHARHIVELSGGIDGESAVDDDPLACFQPFFDHVIATYCIAQCNFPKFIRRDIRAWYFHIHHRARARPHHCCFGNG